MTRLPIPGKDEGVWGELLNAYLQKQHSSDGTHNLTKILELPPTSGKVMVSDPGSTSGVVWQDYTSLPNGGMSGQFLVNNAGGHTWISLTKSHVGLDNADNTSDLNKPVSNAVRTELEKKIDKNNAIAFAVALG